MDKNKYYQEIKEMFDWDGVREDALENLDEDGIGGTFLGTVMSLVPSGCYYTFWANGNVTDDDIEDDELWWEALEQVLDEYGMDYECGDDPCDIFAIIDGFSYDKGENKDGLENQVS